jgi:DNA-binding MarR family transcriptional regulator
LSRSIAGLDKLGFVGRRESAAARRSRLVTLPPPGRAALARVSEARNAVIAAVAATLPDEERTALRDALLPIAERIGPA